MVVFSTHSSLSRSSLPRRRTGPPHSPSGTASSEPHSRATRWFSFTDAAISWYERECEHVLIRQPGGTMQDGTLVSFNNYLGITQLFTPHTHTLF